VFARELPLASHGF
jgi:hypothetical protein